MAKGRFYFKAWASSSVEVELDQGDMSDEGFSDTLLEKAYDGLDTGLCHQCARHVDLGDFFWDEEEMEVEG